MAKFDGFIGGSYESRAVAFDAQRSFNLYLEQDETGGAKSDKCLMGTPGLVNWLLLPTAPIRGQFGGLAGSIPGTTAADQCYVVAGSKFYQVFSGATYNQIGDVGDDAAHSPATIQVNGAQVMITSAGLVWIWDGTTLAQATYNDGYGTCNTSGTAVTWVTGSPFDSSQVGSGIKIASTVYLISAVAASGASLTLASSAGTLTGAAFSVFAGGATVNVSTPISTPTVFWQSGADFTGLQAGQQIIIAATVYTIAAVQSLHQLTLTSSAGTQTGVQMSFDIPVLGGMGAYIDTYFVGLPPNTGNVTISKSFDGKTWDPLDVAVKESFPDNVNAIWTDHEQLWVMGTEASEIWTDTGAASFPLQRAQVVSTGIRAPFTFRSLGNGVCWLGGNQDGNPIAYYCEGYIPARVSTHAIEEQWGTYSTVADAEAWTETRDGHLFWVINFPGGNATWVYDLVEKAWHERGWYNGATFDRHRARCHSYVFGKHIVGDWQTGQLYTMSSTAYDDAGTTIYRIRTATHLSNEENWTFHNRFRLAMQRGPSPTLTWSDDLGNSYGAAKAASPRSFGGIQQNSEWRRLGKSRSRIYQVTITDAVQVCLIAAYLDLEEGGG